MDTYKVMFFISVGSGQMLREGMIIESDKLQLTFHVPEKDMNSFTRVLRTNGIGHTTLPDDPAIMAPEETEVIYTEGDDDYENELTD